MKKLLILLILTISLFVSGCGKGKVVEITYNEFKNRVSNKEDFILFIGANTCSHCAEFKITLEDVIDKYNITFNYLDIDKLTSEQEKDLKDMITFTGTPTTVFIEDGQDNSCNLFSCDKTKRIDGARDYETIISILKNMGYIEG